MKNAPQIPTDETASVSHAEKSASENKAATAPVIKGAVKDDKKRTRDRVQPLKAGDSYTRPVLGRDVTFKLKVIPKDEVAERTSVWKNNERMQEFLTEESLSDILPGLRADGQQVPAYGRELPGGDVEAADGSRRRRGAILAPCDYLIWVADLSDEEMDFFTRVGNEYLPPSAYERGKRYQRMMDNGLTQREIAEQESLNRNIIRRCILTASLPEEIVRLFPRINDLEARPGERLAKARTPQMIEYAKTLSAPQEPEHLVNKLLAAAVPAKPAAPPQWQDSHWSIGYESGKGLRIDVGEEVPEKLRAKIEKWVKKQLAAEEA
ncbi:ParB/RepB/Spo0J family partition protein (plasmid) [Microbulbifer sp. ANSA001]|uniref:ParB/RepB/Spo0J family partition protein n=1 Tax=Microbulbifer sp. ANSA001 TaxID=3243358 RepID=UPI00404282B6